MCFLYCVRFAATFNEFELWANVCVECPAYIACTEGSVDILHVEQNL